VSQSEKLDYFVSCPPGIESILASECRKINLVRKKIPLADQEKQTGFVDEDAGGIEFEGTLEDIYRANLFLRTASRVSIRLGEFYAAAFSELRKKAARLEWSRYLIPGQTVNIKSVCHKSKLYHSDAVSERVLGAINDQFAGSGKAQVSTSKDGQLIQVRLVKDLCTISLDSSGELLYKRGYRQAVAKAPLRENLAAAMILYSGWDGVSPLIDPFCGSGTIPIEAALIAANVPSGINREFQFMKWSGFYEKDWKEILEIGRKAISIKPAMIFGYDRDTGAIEMAKANAARAGQMGSIEFISQAISFLEPKGTNGWLLTNPPYGVRVSENKDLRDLYARFGEIFLQKFSGWKVAFLSSSPILSGNTHLGIPEKRVGFSNGGIPVEIQYFSIV
jgi:putative N6-adenine-specific DNA methylase